MKTGERYLQASKEFLGDIKHMKISPKAEEPGTPCSLAECPPSEKRKREK